MGSDRAGLQLCAEGQDRLGNTSERAAPLCPRSRLQHSCRGHLRLPRSSLFSLPSTPREITVSRSRRQEAPLFCGFNANSRSTRPWPRTTWVRGWLLANPLLSSETLNHFVIAPLSPFTSALKKGPDELNIGRSLNVSPFPESLTFPLQSIGLKPRE